MCPSSISTRAVDWYRAFFDRPPDMVAHVTKVLRHVAERGWIYVLGDPSRVGTAIISDLEEVMKQLEDRGISPSVVETIPDAGRKASYRDPEGSTISLIEVDTPHSGETRVE